MKYAKRLKQSIANARQRSSSKSFRNIIWKTLQSSIFPGHGNVIFQVAEHVTLQKFSSVTDGFLEIFPKFLEKVFAEKVFSEKVFSQTTAFERDTGKKKYS